MMDSLDAEFALKWTVNLATIGLLLQSIADIQLHRNWRTNDLRSWPVIRERWPRIKRRPYFAKLLDSLFNYPGIMSMIGLRLIVAPLLLIFPLPSGISIGALIFICGSNTLLRLRTHWVAGDQSFAQLLFLAVLLSIAAGYTPIAQTVCLWFIALQACLAYFANGLRKINHSRWREGEAMQALAAHPMLGWPSGNSWLLMHPASAKFLTYSVLLMQIIMPLILITGPVGLSIGLSWAFSFHLATALLFRLGSFFWTFITAFPGIIYCNAMVTSCWLER